VTWSSLRERLDQIALGTAEEGRLCCAYFPSVVQDHLPILDITYREDGHAIRDLIW
jgi:hypothetical protein